LEINAENKLPQGVVLFHVSDRPHAAANTVQTLQPLHSEASQNASRDRYFASVHELEVVHLWLVERSKNYSLKADLCNAGPSVLKAGGLC
jgi:hypothetical protein